MEFSMYTQLAVLTTIASAIGIVYQFGKCQKRYLASKRVRLTLSKRNSFTQLKDNI